MADKLAAGSFFGRQIAVRPITVGVGIPPFYPPTEVFFFKKVESE